MEALFVLNIHLSGEEVACVNEAWHKHPRVLVAGRLRAGGVASRGRGGGRHHQSSLRGRCHTQAQSLSLAWKALELTLPMAFSKLD